MNHAPQLSAQSLRKAAILVASLSSAEADRLLSQMGTAQASRVRHAVAELDELDPREQRLVIEEFMRTSAPQPWVGTESQPTKIEHPGIELDDALAARLQQPSLKYELTESTGQAEEHPPFRFLHEAAGDTLTRFLQHEHPQTIAVVLSHLPAARAAEVITRLEAKLQVDVLRRIAELDETPPEVLRDLEQSLKLLLSDELRLDHRRSAGLAVVANILRATQREQRNEVLSHLQRHAEPLARQLTRPREGQAPAEPRVGTETKRVGTEAQTTKRVGTEAQTTGRAGSEAQATQPPWLKFADLTRLSDQALARLLHAAGPQTTLLALTGASSELVDRILHQLPAREAKQLRRRIEHTGPLRLSDVEQAQLQLVQLASQLISRDELQPPPTRRFAAAA